MRLEGAAGPIQLDIRPDWRQTLTSIAGIVSVLLVAAGLFYTNNANRKQQEATRAQQALAERGQLTDRFGRAIDQLGQEGADKLSIRLGGIYALEQLMRDSRDDGPAIVEVLSVFIRTHAVTQSVNLAAPARVQPSPNDVQVAVAVLARRPDWTLLPNFSGVLLGLQDADLRDAAFVFVDLRGADLSGADLANARLFGARLSGAKLAGARLAKADLIGVNFEDADLTNSDFSAPDVFLVEDGRGRDPREYAPKLSGADLTGARLAGADFTGNDLSDAQGLTSEMLHCALTDGTDLPSGVVGRPSEVVKSDSTCSEWFGNRPR